MFIVNRVSRSCSRSRGFKVISLVLNILYKRSICTISISCTFHWYISVIMSTYPGCAGVLKKLYAVYQRYTIRQSSLFLRNWLVCSSYASNGILLSEKTKLHYSVLPLMLRCSKGIIFVHRTALRSWEYISKDFTRYRSCVLSTYVSSLNSTKGTVWYHPILTSILVHSIIFVRSNLASAGIILVLSAISHNHPSHFDSFRS